MTKITNKTPHPFDIHTKQGPKVIHAFGELTADFEPAYLELIRLSFDVEKVDAQEQEQEQEQADDSGVDSGADSTDADADQPQEQPQEQAEEVTETASEEPAGEVAEAAEEEASQESVEPEVVLTDADRYQAITGKKPDGRWSEERLLAEIAKLKG